MTFTRILLLPAIAFLGTVLWLGLRLDRPRGTKTVDTLWREDSVAARFRRSEGSDFNAKERGGVL
jgi:hypothetical protein